MTWDVPGTGDTIVLAGVNLMDESLMRIDKDTAACQAQLDTYRANFKAQEAGGQER